jgi:hypothetical protein
MANVILAPCVLGLTSWSNASAQSWFELGVKGGLGLANISSQAPLSGMSLIDEPLADGGYAQGTISTGLGDQKPGFVGGAYAMAHLDRHFGIRIEALYSNKGTTGKNSGAIDVYDATNTFVGTYDVTGKNTLTLAYLEIPILAVTCLPDGPHGEFEVFAGPALAFKNRAELKQEITLTYYGQSQSGSQTQDVGDNTADTDIGGVLGIGYSHRAGGVIVSGDVRWTQGFSQIDNADLGWKNHVFALSLGVGVPLGGSK